MKLDHATIVTKDVKAIRDFFCNVVGLIDGPRPAFGVAGHWLYANGQPLFHVIEDTHSAPARWASSRIDHVALRIDSAEEWKALLERLQLNRIPYERAQVPSTGESQLFVAFAPGVAIEFVTQLPNVDSR